MLSPLLCKIASWRGVKARSPRPRVRLFLQGLQNRDGPSVLAGVAGSCISLLYIEGTASLALDNVEPVATHARPEPRTAAQLVPGTAVTTIRNRWDTGEPVLSAAWLASEFEDLHARRDPLEDLVTAAMDSQVGYTPGLFPSVVITSDLIRSHASVALDHSTNRVQEISKGPSVHSSVFSAPLSNDASPQDVRTNSPVVAPAQSVRIANLDDRPGLYDEGVAPDSALAELSGSTEEFLFGSDLNPAGDGPDG